MKLAIIPSQLCVSGCLTPSKTEAHMGLLLGNGLDAKVSFWQSFIKRKVAGIVISHG